MENSNKIIWSRVLGIVNLLFAGYLLLWGLGYALAFNIMAYAKILNIAGSFEKMGEISWLTALFTGIVLIFGLAGWITDIVTLFAKSKRTTSLITLTAYLCYFVFSAAVYFTIQTGLAYEYLMLAAPVVIIALINFMIIRSMFEKN